MAEPSSPTTDLKNDGVTNNDVPLTGTADVRGGIDDKENTIPNAEDQQQSAAASSAQGKENASALPNAASRDNSPPEQNSPPIDNDAVLQAQTTILPSTASDHFNDDGYDSDGASKYSTSLSSSVNDYVFSHGRRYHRFREGAYSFPNDDAEQEREDMKHAMVIQLCGKLHFAPLEELIESGHGLERIIDLGTGTGIWAIEMGDKYPSAQILGIDLSPIQPIWVPPNVSFMVDDAESPWLQPPNHFDYIHSRHMAVSYKNWTRLLEQSFTHLRPGGYIEIQDFIYYPQCQDGTMPDDWPLLKFYKLCSEGLSRLGLDPFVPSSIAARLTATGFTNVQVQILNAPIGRWPKNRTLRSIGMYWQACIEDFLQAAGLGLLVKALGWSREEVEVFLVDVRKSLGKEGEGIHTSMPLYCVYGQKPETAHVQ